MLGIIFHLGGMETRDAAGNDRPGKNGRQHGAPADARWPRGGRLLGHGQDERELRERDRCSRSLFDRRTGRQAEAAPSGLVDGARSRGRPDPGRIGRSSAGRRRRRRRRQFLLRRRHPAGRRVLPGGGALRRLWDQRGCLGSRARILPHDRRAEEGRRAPGPDLQDPRAGTRGDRPDPRSKAQAEERRKKATSTVDRQGRDIS